MTICKIRRDQFQYEKVSETIRLVTFVLALPLGFPIGKLVSPYIIISSIEILFGMNFKKQQIIWFPDDLHFNRQFCFQCTAYQICNSTSRCFAIGSFMAKNHPNGFGRRLLGAHASSHMFAVRSKTFEKTTVCLNSLWCI